VLTGSSCRINRGSRMFCRSQEHTTIRCLEYLPAFAAPILLDLTRLEFPAAQFNENVGEECRSHQPYINRQTLGALHASRLSDVNRLLAEAWTPRQLCAPQWRQLSALRRFFSAGRRTDLGRISVTICSASIATFSASTSARRKFSAKLDFIAHGCPIPDNCKVVDS
jgi:hypothetical protein